MKGLKAVACSAALVAALAAAGCGSSDDDSSSDAPELTKAQFIEQANAICASSNEAIDSASNKVFTNGQPSQAEIENFVTATVIPQVESQLEGIHALGVPAGEEDQVNEVLDAADSALEEAKSDPGSLAGNSDPFAEANKLAGDYGLTDCAG